MPATLGVVAAGPTLVEAIRRIRRELAEAGPVDVRAAGDFERVSLAVNYYEVNAGWQAVPIGRDTRLRAYRLPNPKLEPSFERFAPFGLDSPG